MYFFNLKMIFWIIAWFNQSISVKFILLCYIQFMVKHLVFKNKYFLLYFLCVWCLFLYNYFFDHISKVKKKNNRQPEYNNYLLWSNSIQWRSKRRWSSCFCVQIKENCIESKEMRMVSLISIELLALQLFFYDYLVEIL